MTTPIKDVVARLRELMAKATPGPWSTDAERPRLVNDGDGYFDEMGGGVPYDLGPDDAEFTVEAVNALPPSSIAWRRLRQENPARATSCLMRWHMTSKQQHSTKAPDSPEVRWLAQAGAWGLLSQHACISRCLCSGHEKTPGW